MANGVPAYGTTRMQHLIYDPDAVQQPTDQSLKMVEGWARDTVSPYMPYTPVLTGTSGGFAYGTGAFQVGRWKRMGSQCKVEIQIYFGSPGFVPGGATQWNISLPIVPLLAQLPTPFTQKLLGSVFLKQGTGQVQFMHGAVTTKTAGATDQSFSVLLSNQGNGVFLKGTTPTMAEGATLFASLDFEVAQ